MNQPYLFVAGAFSSAGRSQGINRRSITVCMCCAFCGEQVVYASSFSVSAANASCLLPVAAPVILVRSRWA